MFISPLLVEVILSSSLCVSSPVACAIIPLTIIVCVIGICCGANRIIRSSRHVLSRLIGDWIPFFLLCLLSAEDKIYQCRRLIGHPFLILSPCSHVLAVLCFQCLALCEQMV